MNKWHYDKTQEVHTYVDKGQEFTWKIKMKNTEDYEFVLTRTWQIKPLSGQTDYIGTFKELDMAKQVADLIRTG